MKVIDINEREKGKINSILDTIYCGAHRKCNILRVLDEEKNFDEYTYTHSLNVAYYAMQIAKWMGFEDDDINEIIKAGLLHDIGKIKIPIKILNKKSKLSKEEFDLIKRHTIYGYEIVKSMRCLSDEICYSVLLHHEREDRSGYPYGFGSEQINRYAKIIAIADVYDAMTSNREYKKGATPFEAFEMFNTIGAGSFDAHITKTFLMNMSASLCRL